jgi:hypothetical protein
MLVEHIHPQENGCFACTQVAESVGVATSSGHSSPSKQLTQQSSMLPSSGLASKDAGQ